MRGLQAAVERGGREGEQRGEGDAAPCASAFEDDHVLWGVEAAWVRALCGLLPVLDVEQGTQTHMQSCIIGYILNSPFFEVPATTESKIFEDPNPVLLPLAKMCSHDNVFRRGPCTWLLGVDL